MKPGDTMRHYGVVFRITEIVVYTDSWHLLKRGEFGPPLPCYVGRTELVQYPDSGSVMPRHWADTWTFQGNHRATFTKVLDA